MGCICLFPVQHLEERVKILEQQFVELERRNAELRDICDRLADMLVFDSPKGTFKRLHEIHDFILPELNRKLS